MKLPYLLLIMFIFISGCQKINLDYNDYSDNIVDSMLNILGKATTSVYINTFPQFIKNMPNFTWTGNTNFVFNITQYFSDPDGHNMTFTINSTNIQLVDLNNDNIRLEPNSGWYGSEHVLFTAQDPYTLSAQATQSNIILITVTQPSSSSTDVITGSSTKTKEIIKQDIVYIEKPTTVIVKELEKPSSQQIYRDISNKPYRLSILILTVIFILLLIIRFSDYFNKK